MANKYIIKLQQSPRFKSVQDEMKRVGFSLVIENNDIVFRKQTSNSVSESRTQSPLLQSEADVEFWLEIIEKKAEFFK